MSRPLRTLGLLAVAGLLSALLAFAAIPILLPEVRNDRDPVAAYRQDLDRDSTRQLVFMVILLVGTIGGTVLGARLLDRTKRRALADKSTGT